MKIIEQWDSIGTDGMHELLVEMSVEELAKLRSNMTIELESAGTCNVQSAKVMPSQDGKSVRVKVDVYEQGG